eukprot:gene2614-3372_t
MSFIEDACYECLDQLAYFFIIMVVVTWNFSAMAHLVFGYRCRLFHQPHVAFSSALLFIVQQDMGGLHEVIRGTADSSGHLTVRIYLHQHCMHLP